MSKKLSAAEKLSVPERDVLFLYVQDFTYQQMADYPNKLYKSKSLRGDVDINVRETTQLDVFSISSIFFGATEKLCPGEEKCRVRFERWLQANKKSSLLKLAPSSFSNEVPEILSLG